MEAPQLVSQFLSALHKTGIKHQIRPDDEPLAGDHTWTGNRYQLRIKDEALHLRDTRECLTVQQFSLAEPDLLQASYQAITLDRQ